MSASPEPDPYVVLGVSRTASDAEIRSAYLALVARYHPDRHQGNPLEDLAGIKMAEINRAYQTLADAERRAACDRDTGGSGTAAGGGPRNTRAVKIVAVLMALPVLVSVGGLLIRALVALVRVVAESTGWLRGTPFAAGLALLVATLLLIAFFRHRRAKSRSRSPEP